MADANNDHHYRRGLVLGLTLAETFLLLLFVLMLILSLRLLNEIEQHAETQKQHAEAQKQHAKIQEKLEEEREKLTSLTEQLDSLVDPSNPNREYSDTFSELVLERNQLQKKADVLQKKTSELQERSDRTEQQLQEKTEQLQGYQAIERALGEAEMENYSPEQIAEALEDTEEVLELKHAIGEAGLPTDPGKLAEVLRDKNKELAAAVEGQEASKQRLDYFKRTSGRSNELPSCWIHPETNRAEYIFDTSLQSNGLMLHKRIIPHREADTKQLPVASIRYRLMMDRQEFKAAVFSLWKWSEANECRFHVRVFDYTGEQEKEHYKNLLQTVENSFYIYRVRDNTTTRPGEVRAP